MSSSRVLRCARILRVDRTHKGALSSLRNLPLCTVDEFLAAARDEALSDVVFLREQGFALREVPTSPAVQQGGSVGISQPIASSAPLGGPKGRSKKRLKGTPLKAKKAAVAVGSNRPDKDSDSPSESLSGLL